MGLRREFENEPKQAQVTKCCQLLCCQKDAKSFAKGVKMVKYIKGARGNQTLACSICGLIDKM